MSKRVPPSVVPLSAVPPTPAAEAVTGVRIARLITQKRSGSNLTQGCSWLDPGEVSKAWTSTEERGPNSGDHWYGPVLETYFIISGHLQLTWDEGVLDLNPHDSVFLAPGWRYQLANVGDEPAFFVYNMTPSQE